MQALQTGIHPGFPISVARVAQDKILFASGVGPVQRWDGLASSSEDAGVIAPTASPTITGLVSGTGIISGTYNCYYRYLDNDRLPSSLSPVSNTIEIPDNAKASSIRYTNIAAPTESKVNTIQILRNTSGQSAVYYVDIEISLVVDGVQIYDSWATALSDANVAARTSIRQDSTPATEGPTQALDLQEAVVIETANRYTPPPRNKAVIAYHQGRVFMAVEREYSEGTVRLTAGSTLVQGIGTRFTAAMRGRTIYIAVNELGEPNRSYRIASVDVDAQTLTLTEPYGSTYQNRTHAGFTIRTTANNRRALVYSEAFEPESWPTTNSLTVPETNDELTGLLSKGSFLYIFERHHTHRLTFSEDPAIDGSIFLQSRRGCVNNRCYAEVNDQIFALDTSGIHVFGGGQASVPISNPIQEIFRPGSQGINWEASQWFHAVHYPGQECIRWFVALSGRYLPRDTICYNYRTDRWWIDKYPQHFGASCLAEIDIRRVLVGGQHATIYALSVGTLDGVSLLGTLRGTVTSSTLYSITDTSADFLADGIVGSTLTIVEGKGKGQQRQIVSVDGQTITILTPFLSKPDTTSVYQIGGINWKYRSGWFQWADNETPIPRRVSVAYRPTSERSTVNVRVYRNLSDNAVKWGRSMDEDGVSCQKGSADITIDLGHEVDGVPLGYAGFSMDDGNERFLHHEKFVSVELEGFSGKDRVSVSQIDIEGATDG